ncbi:uncharacterized protein LOC131316375 [Rhododendron vialii]|uniref:uncharacterized protein LOC131316375 n=1 Tax=Rhododendron vialii TaxID=182163 RepID=UPI00266040B4|nr:uncharacterized protein LOC131316375 [Rhododendron vialii]XP_058201706.1 uncharacterized protein LOC131316375 [Rhododendron vialii]XP_058201708.1 uncharacterized protein LOC131316375 [Rhododendron vialii]
MVVRYVKEDLLPHSDSTSEPPPLFDATSPCCTHFTVPVCSTCLDAKNYKMQMMELSTQMEGSSTESTCIDEDSFVKVMGPKQPGSVRTFGLGPSIKDVFAGGYPRSQEETHIFQAQMQD